VIHPHTVVAQVSPEVGVGVFATHLIPRGTITWVLDPLDQRFSPRQLELLGPAFGPLLRRYCYPDDEGMWVLAWDHGRLVNHSCAANCASGGDDQFEVALRDIQPGEQLTDDYGELLGGEVFECGCGGRDCRGLVGLEDPASRRARSRLRPQVDAALALGSILPQPLLPYALDRARLEATLRLGATSPSRY